MGLLPEVYNINNYVLGVAQHLPVETIKESTIHTIRRLGRNLTETIQFKETFNKLFLYRRLAIYLFQKPVLLTILT